MKALDAMTQLGRLAAPQWDLVTTGQAEAIGVTRLQVRRLCDKGHLRQVRRGVYALPSDRFNALQELRAAWLATVPKKEAEARILADDDIVVSHLSAATVHKLGDLIPVQHEFASHRRHRSADKGVRFHRMNIDPADKVLVDGLPITSIERTVFDLARTIDFDHLSDVVRDALSSSEVSLETLEEKLDVVADRFGCKDGNALVQKCLESAGYPQAAKSIAKMLIAPEVLKPALEQLRAVCEKINKVSSDPEVFKPITEQLLTSVKQIYLFPAFKELAKFG